MIKALCNLARQKLGFIRCLDKDIKVCSYLLVLQELGRVGPLLLTYMKIGNLSIKKVYLIINNDNRIIQMQ